MKLIIILFVLTLQLSTLAQTNKYPNVEYDQAEDQNYTIDAKFNFYIPGVMGLGMAGSYYMSNLFHISAEAGLGWTFKTKKADTHKKWVMPWYGVKVGYPLSFVTSGKVKWIFSQSSSRQSFYKIAAPVHHMIIPEAGLFFNPVSYKAKQYIAPVFKAGLSWRTIVNADVKVKDSSSGKIRSGTLKRHTEFSVGVLWAMKDDILGSNMTDPAIKTNKPGFYVLLGLPIWGQTFNLAINSIGYDNQSQFLVGWTFNIK